MILIDAGRGQVPEYPLAPLEEVVEVLAAVVDAKGAQALGQGAFEHPAAAVRRAGLVASHCPEPKAAGLMQRDGQPS
jgi:hypothetical protein